MVNDNSSQQRKEQSARSAPLSSEARGSPDALVREQISNRPKHICRKKIIRHHRDSDQEKRGGNTGQIRHSQTDHAHQAAAIHGDLANMVSVLSLRFLQPSRCSRASQNPTRVSPREKWESTPRSDLGQRQMADAEQIARYPVPVELHHGTDEEAAQHHGPAGRLAQKVAHL